MINIHKNDQWGGIDEKIKPAVWGLNQMGIETTGSCEGDNAPLPWISIKSSSENTKKEVDKLLGEFYAEQDARQSIKIKKFPMKSGRFWLYAGPEERFKKWRDDVNETADAIARGEDPGPRGDESSPKIYQDEFVRFGKFLCDKANSPVPKKEALKGSTH